MIGKEGKLRMMEVNDREDERREEERAERENTKEKEKEMMG